MAVVAHLVGLEQLGYETDLGLTTAVRIIHIISSFLIKLHCFCSYDLGKLRLSVFLNFSETTIQDWLKYWPLFLVV